MEILIKRLNPNAKLPVYGREAGPGIDLYTIEDVTIPPGEKKVLSTGISMAMPVGYIGVICGSYGMVVGDSSRVTASVLDSGYREEIKIEITNNGSESCIFRTDEKIAQILVHKVEHSRLIEVEDLDGGEEEGV